MQHREKLTSYFLDRWMSALNNFNVISNFFHSHSIQSSMRDLLGFWKTYLRFLYFVHSSGLSILLWLGCWCFCGWGWLWRPCFCHKQRQQHGGGLVDAEQCRGEPSTALWSFYFCLCLFLYLQLYLKLHLFLYLYLHLCLYFCLYLRLYWYSAKEFPKFSTMDSYSAHSSLEKALAALAAHWKIRAECTRTLLHWRVLTLHHTLRQSRVKIPHLGQQWLSKLFSLQPDAE